MIWLPKRNELRLALLTLLMLSTVAACRPAAPPAESRPAKHVVLICVDTFGAEHMGGMFRGASHTPRLDGLANDGLLFRRAYAPAPWTQPSVASMFTGKLPHRHGMMRFGRVLDNHENTIAEAFGERGFATAGFVSHLVLRERYGFAQGFERFDDSAVAGHRGITSHQVTDLAIDWLEDRDERPFFLFLHYFDPHYVYRDHPEFDLAGDYDGPLEPGMGIWDLRERRSELTPADVNYLVNLHHEELAYTDSHIGRLLDWIDEAGLRDDTLVALVADHGEEFMRHGWIGHTRTLYDELLRVPMILNLPGRFEPRVVDWSVSVMDLKPTLLALAGHDVEAENLDGRSLIPYIRRDLEPDWEREIWGEVDYVAPSGFTAERREQKRANKTSLLIRGRKVIHDLETDGWEFYVQKKDAGELNDLAGQGHPDELPMREKLAQWEAGRGDYLGAVEASDVDIDEAELEKLRSLGYAE